MLKPIANGFHDSSFSPLVVLVLVLVLLAPTPLLLAFSHPLLFLVLLIFLQNEVCFRKALLSASSLVHATALNPKEHSSDSGENSSDTCATSSTF